MKTSVHITVAGPQTGGALVIARAILELLHEASIQCSMPEEAENPTDGDSIEALGYLTRNVGPLHVTVHTSDDAGELRARIAELEAERDRMLPIYTAHFAQEQAAAAYRDRERLRIAALTEHELHSEQRHPDYEYATTENARKSGDSPKPEGDGWEPNAIVLITNGLLGSDDLPRYCNWERRAYTETNYWRRRKPVGEVPH